MFFRYQRRRNVLNISDSFATLKSISDAGDLEFEFEYSLSQATALQLGALTVQISVATRVITRKPILADSYRGFIDNKSLVKNVLMQMPDAKSTIKQQREYVAAERFSDVTAKINNEIAGQLHAGVKPKQIQQAHKLQYKKVVAGTLKANNDVKPIVQVSAHNSIKDTYAVMSASLEMNPRSVMNDMLVRQGIDPSHITALQHRSIPFDDAVQGTLRPTRAAEEPYDKSVQLLNHHIFNVDKNAQLLSSNDAYDEQTINVLVVEPIEDVNVTTRVVIPNAKRKLDGMRDAGTAFVKFSLLNTRTGVVVDYVTKQLDIARHVQVYNTPKKAPHVKLAKSDTSSRACIEVTQVDPTATSVQLYKKSISKVVPDVEDYSLIGTYGLKHSNQSLLVQVDAPRNSSAVYRVIPVGVYGVKCSEYANVVVNPSRYSRVKSIALTASSVEAGIKLEARKIPSSIVALQFLVRNLTLHETAYTIVGTPQLVDDTVRIADYVSIVDSTVQFNWIYEYSVRLISSNGDVDDVGSTIIEFVQITPEKFDTRITAVTVSYDNQPNVTFNVATTVVDGNLDTLKSLLEQQGMLKYFEENVKDERELLKNIVAHSVQRVDVTTGLREDFGTMSTNAFSDADMGPNCGVSPLRLGHKYRYDVSPLIRAPETMFETLTVDRVDQTTGKPYSFKPSKFLHPLTLKHGSLVSPRGIRVQHAGDSMQHGLVGQVQYVEVSFDDDPAYVVDARAAVFSNTLVILTWRVKGRLASVDHFLIMKEVDGIRTVIGKAHSGFEHNECQYLHVTGRRDVGELQYVVTPVFNDYNVGVSVTTNPIVV